jgi:gas vesicle protein GvpL/GvpF
VIELLAITDDATPPEPPLVAVRSGGLSVLCAPAEADEPVTPDALWRREAIIEDLMAARDLLPVRYGTRVADEAAAADAVAERRDELEAGLARVRGAVELAVRVHAEENDEPPRDVSGRDYLRARLARSDAAAELHEPLAALARDSSVQPGAELLRAAYLVEREAVGAFVARVRELQDERPELAVLCTGPWPPYSFASPPKP